MKKISKVLAIALAVIMIMMTSITAFADYPVLTEGELHSVNIVNEVEDTVTFTFQSDKTAEYVLCSYNNEEDDDIDPYVTIYDEDGYEVAYGDDTYEDFNFVVRFTVQAGAVYYIEVASFNGDDSFDIMLEACDEHTECYDNDWNGYCDWCDELLCDHACHKDGIAGFFWRITNFFNMIFFINPFCECGAWHY